MADRRDRKKLPMDRSKVVLTEGIDECYFTMHALEKYGISDVQVVCYEGISSLAGFLPVFVRDPMFVRGEIESVLVVRDAEGDAISAFKSVSAALSSVGMSAPPSAGIFVPGPPKVGIYIMPGSNHYSLTQQHDAPTMFEDLLWSMIDQGSVTECVESFLDCTVAAGSLPRKTAKARIHAYLSGSDKFTGLKIGEAAKAGAWNWEHQALKDFKQMLREL